MARYLRSDRGVCLCALRVALVLTVESERRMRGGRRTRAPASCLARSLSRLAAEEAHRPEPETGSWPWLAAPMIARWALQVAAAEAKGLPAVLDRDATSYAADVLCRGVLETSSLLWWLFDPGIDAERRVARSLVYCLHSARQTGRAISAPACHSRRGRRSDRDGDRRP